MWAQWGAIHKEEERFREKYSQCSNQPGYGSSIGQVPCLELLTVLGPLHILFLIIVIIHQGRHHYPHPAGEDINAPSLGLWQETTKFQGMES